MAHARSAQEIAAVLQYAGDHSLELTARGAGYSQSGQSIASGGVTLDVSRLDHVGPPDLDTMTIKCGPGARWRNLVRRCAPAGVLPQVMPLNLDLTVGGVLSAGGVGATSHLFGPTVATVAALQAVGGDGANYDSTYPGLDAAVLAGLGRAAVLTQAELKLRRIRPRVRVLSLLYESAADWLREQRQLASSGVVQYLEGLCLMRIVGSRVTPNGRRPVATWSYLTLAGVEHDGEAPPKASDILAASSSARVMFDDDDETVAFASRYDPRFEAMRRTGAWTQAHPWVEILLPEQTFDALLPELLNALPPFLGDGHRIALMANQGPSLFMRPEGAMSLNFAVLPMGIPDALRDDALRALRALHDLGVAAGGKRYLSGWLGMMDEPGWRLHYGDAFDAWLAAKARFDPNGVLGSALFDGALRL